jgi:hypothetical protein
MSPSILSARHAFRSLRSDGQQVNTPMVQIQEWSILSDDDNRLLIRFRDKDVMVLDPNDSSVNFVHTKSTESK